MDAYQRQYGVASLMPMKLLTDRQSVNYIIILLHT